MVAGGVSDEVLSDSANCIQENRTISFLSRLDKQTQALRYQISLMFLEIVFAL